MATALNELSDRCERALVELEGLRNKAAALHNTTEHSRLAGKIEGVKLVLDYMRAYEPPAKPWRKPTLEEQPF